MGWKRNKTCLPRLLLRSRVAYSLLAFCPAISFTHTGVVFVYQCCFLSLLKLDYTDGMFVNQSCSNLLIFCQVTHLVCLCIGHHEIWSAEAFSIGPCPAQNWNWAEIREIEPITSTIQLLNHHQMQIGGLNVPFWGSGMDQFISQIILGFRKRGFRRVCWFKWIVPRSSFRRITQHMPELQPKNKYKKLRTKQNNTHKNYERKTLQAN